MTVTSRGISLPKELDEQLVEQARREDRSISGVIRQALQLYLTTRRSLFLSDASPRADDMIALDNTQGGDGNAVPAPPASEGPANT